MEEDEAGPSGEDEAEEPTFQAFVGSGRRLDGKPSTSAPTPALPARSTAASGTRKPGGNTRHVEHLMVALLHPALPLISKSVR